MNHPDFHHGCSYGRTRNLIFLHNTCISLHSHTLYVIYSVFIYAVREAYGFTCDSCVLECVCLNILRHGLTYFWWSNVCHGTRGQMRKLHFVIIVARWHNQEVTTNTGSVWHPPIRMPAHRLTCPHIHWHSWMAWDQGILTGLSWQLQAYISAMLEHPTPWHLWCLQILILFHVAYLLFLSASTIYNNNIQHGCLYISYLAYGSLQVCRTLQSQS